jgi:membrane-bound metal-dependent hydrolase YbcI (DUF457 family)
MDTITHGIAGALLGKALFKGDDLFTFRPYSQERLVTFAVTLGAVFPDSDALLDFVSRDPMRIITWHRGVTHSLVLLPLFAVVLAWLTRRVAGRLGYAASGLGALAGLYAVGIASHILLDLLTNYGTMIWSPLGASRPAWDLLFIVDLTFSSLVLLPQLLAALYGQREAWRRRAVRAWCVCMALAVLAWRVAEGAGFPFSLVTLAAVGAILLVVFVAPGIRGWGFHPRRQTWCRGGVLGVAAYVALAGYAHHEAVSKVGRFAGEMHLDVQSLAALPLPPSVWHWRGLVVTPRGVYEKSMDLWSPSSEDSFARALGSERIEYRYYPDAPSNAYIAAARELPAVKTMLWFARFPVIRFWKEGTDAVVELVDLRFAGMGGGPTPFTYRVRFDAAGKVLSQGLVRR